MRWPIILLLLLSIGGGRPAGAAPIPAMLAQIPAVTPTGTPVVIDASAGDQIDPHVSGALVSYTNDVEGSQDIRYFSLLTNTGAAVPTSGAAFLSDVSGNRIVYTNVTPAGSQIGVFDVGTSTATTIPGGNQRTDASIAGNTVAFEDRSFSANRLESEIVLYDLATVTTTRLTNDTLQDLAPTVSPDGNVIVWTKCQPTNPAQGCDIYQAVRTGGSWVTTQVTGAPGEDSRPDTNGQLVVYQSTRGGEADIYYKPVAGGTETPLALPGTQRNPSIAGTFIAFESVTAQNNFDLFVYDTATNTYYRVTQTAVDETLNDITVLADGRVRVVYSARSALGFDVFAFTFQPAPPAGTFPLSLTLSQLQLRSSGGTEKVQVQGNVQLAGTSDGMDPRTQPVNLRLSTAAGPFYPPPGSPLLPINGFDPTPTGWAISAAEKQRTGLQAFVIDRTATGFTFNVVDTQAPLAASNYSTVTVELAVGNDVGSATVSLVNNPAGSGSWQLR